MVPDRFPEDLDAPVLVPPDFEDGDLLLAALVLELDRERLPAFVALPERLFDLEAPPDREAADFDEPDFDAAVGRDDLDFGAVEDFEREEAADVDFRDFEGEPEPFNLELLADFDELPDERPDFVDELFEEVVRFDPELEAFDPPAERLEAVFPAEDLPDLDEAFELDDRLDEVDRELPAFLVVDFEPVDDLEEEDFDPEDFFDDDDFDPEDFLVAAMILIPRSSFN